jgi:hypothetical protein
VTEKTRLAPVPNGFSPLYVHHLAYNDGVPQVTRLFFHGASETPIPEPIGLR